MFDLKYCVFDEFSWNLRKSFLDSWQIFPSLVIWPCRNIFNMAVPELQTLEFPALWYCVTGLPRSTGNPRSSWCVDPEALPWQVCPRTQTWESWDPQLSESPLADLSKRHEPCMALQQSAQMIASGPWTLKVSGLLPWNIPSVRITALGQTFQIAQPRAVFLTLQSLQLWGRQTFQRPLELGTWEPVFALNWLKILVFKKWNSPWTKTLLLIQF